LPNVVQLRGVEDALEDSLGRNLEMCVNPHGKHTGVGQTEKAQSWAFDIEQGLGTANAGIYFTGKLSPFFSR
jgi:hypothetical protein